MNREILFRGKRIDNGEWVEGVPIKTHIGTFIVFEENPHYCGQYGYMEICELSTVDPATVGQYTGLTDKNGKRIFEGDIVRGAMGDMIVFYGEIVGEGYGFQWEAMDGKTCESMTGFIDEYEVIGNIHENPEPFEIEKAAEEADRMGISYGQHMYNRREQP